MQAIVIVALVLHVVSGVFWAGSTFALARMGGNQAREFLRPQLGAAATAIVTGALLWYLLHRGSEGTSERVLATGAIFALIAAGVGDQDVDRPELALDMPAHVLDLAVLRQVRGNLTRAAAGPLDLRPHVRQRRGVPAMQRHLGAFLRKARGDGGADAA